MTVDRLMPFALDNVVQKWQSNEFPTTELALVANAKLHQVDEEGSDDSEDDNSKAGEEDEGKFSALLCQLQQIHSLFHFSSLFP